MNRIHRVIYQEIIPPGLIALAVLTFVVFTREFGRLVELLIRKNAEPLTILQLVVALLPAILIFTVPISFLVGTLVGFSRLSTESEVVAMRAAGIGIYQILRPVLGLGLVVTGVTFLLTLLLLPQGNWKLRQLRHEIGVKPVQSQIRPRVFNEDLPGKLLYVEDIDLQSRVWKGVFFADTRPEGQNRIIVAEEGRVLFTPDNRRLQLYFSNGSVYEYDESDPQRHGLSRFGTLDVSADLPEAAPVSQQPKRFSDKTTPELLREFQDGDQNAAHRASVEVQRRVALPLSALVFAILGVTLGITTHRGGRGYGSIVSMAVAFGYYVLFATGSELAAEGVMNPFLGVWGANLVLTVLALASLYQGRRGLTLTAAVSNSGPVVWTIRTAGRAAHWVAAHSGRLAGWVRQRELLGISGVRIGLARVVDLYMLRIFGTSLLVTLSVCVALFYLFTFFELVDELFENSIEWAVLMEYFAYLLPQVLMLLVPISILISTLITFGLLEKSSEVVAFKASGISVYRIALPILALASVLSLAVFVLEDQILPYANQRQDYLRDVIKGRPVQTYYQAGRNWIFGENNRLYHYNYYDPERRLFAQWSIFELDIAANQLVSHSYAQRGIWRPRQQDWELSEGWQREFSSEDFTEFERRGVIAERPGYFVREVKESSKMTFAELNSYIGELRKGGFEVDHLLTELYKKISFPVVSLLMVVLGIPFAFSVGKKGALYGVATGTLLGIIYWGAFGVFGVLGDNGLLSPVLAAWGPNLVFGSASLLAFLNVRT